MMTKPYSLTLRCPAQPGLEGFLPNPVAHASRLAALAPQHEGVRKC